MVMGLGKKKTTTQTLRDRASGLVDSLAPHVETARGKAGPVLAEARDRAVPVIADVAARTAPALSDARDRTLDALGGARDKAAPVIADARERSAPVVDRITNDLLPALKDALGAVDGATEDARADVAARSAALAAAVQEQVDPKPKRHPIRNSLISLVAGAVTFVVVRRLADRKAATEDWKTAYTPPPAPVASPTVDTAAAGPGEAVADATDVPHGTTTPDHPVVDIDVDKR